MEIVASVSYDREYFEAFYADWIAYRSRYRRWAVPVSVFFLIAASAVCLFLTSHRAIVGGLVVVALLNLIDVLTHRGRWVRQRLATISVDKIATLTFTDDKMRILSPNSEGVISYDAFGVVSVTPNGIFLIPDSGVSIFVPDRAFADRQSFESVCEKLAERAELRSGQN